MEDSPASTNHLLKLHNLSRDLGLPHSWRESFNNPRPGPNMNSTMSTGTPTAGRGANTPETEAQQHYENYLKNRDRFFQDRWNSCPRHQFERQSGDLEKYFLTDPEFSKTLPKNVTLAGHARALVREKWEDLGIWDEKWSEMPDGKWKHDEPLEVNHSDQSEFIQIDSHQIGPLLTDLQSLQQAKREQDRRASRPINQFFAQLLKEAERIAAAIGDCAAINTIAYDNVKKEWISAGIWSSKWVTLPGMQWMHERPTAELLREYEADFGCCPPNPAPPSSREHLSEAVAPRNPDRPKEQTRGASSAPEDVLAAESPKDHDVYAADLNEADGRIQHTDTQKRYLSVTDNSNPQQPAAYSPSGVEHYGDPTRQQRSSIARGSPFGRKSHLLNREINTQDTLWCTQDRAIPREHRARRGGILRLKSGTQLGAASFAWRRGNSAVSSIIWPGRILSC